MLDRMLEDTVKKLNARGYVKDIDRFLEKLQKTDPSGEYVGRHNLLGRVLARRRNIISTFSLDDLLPKERPVILRYMPIRELQTA